MSADWFQYIVLVLESTNLCEDNTLLVYSTMNVLHKDKILLS